NWSKTVSYFSYFLTLLIVVPIWVKELYSFGTFLGLLSAGLAVALKDPIANFFAWIYIILKKPFEMGDRIQIGSSEGDILNISFFEFTLLEIKNWVAADQSTGRIVHVPNGLLFTQPVINYNQGMDYIWNEIPIIVTFESDWNKAKEILLEIEEEKLKPMLKNIKSEYNKAHRKYFVHYSKLTPTVYTSIKENGVLLTLRYLCHPKKRRDSEQTATEEILNRFGRHKDIQFAYPTTRLVVWGQRRKTQDNE
ncbi:MAG TPA: mechanosensitive ion channel family protein, partial [Bacteroidetes bacterium]|nr:mechanosensitive ion channel family protein [Bacteroidota bacterium]